MAIALRNFEVSNDTKTSLCFIMTHPPCLRLCPACPGNPRNRIEGESQLEGNGHTVCLEMARGTEMETDVKSKILRGLRAVVVCTFVGVLSTAAFSEFKPTAGERA